MFILYNMFLDALPADTLELITTVAECKIDVAGRYRQPMQFHAVRCERTQGIRHRFFHLASAEPLPTFQSVIICLILTS